MGIQLEKDPRVEALLALGALNKNYSGFPNRTDSSFSFANFTRTFSIQPTGSFYYFYNKGRKIYKTSTNSIVIPDSEGIHYIYFDEGGVLSSSQVITMPELYSQGYISFLYWDATNKTSIFLGDERHGLQMDWQNHVIHHETHGTYYHDGLLINDIIPDGTGNLNSEATVSISDGKIADEDLVHLITNNSPQVLATIAQIPIYYKEGVNGYWRKTTANNYPVKSFVGGSGLLAYNQFTGGAWQQTEVPNTNYVLTHIWATNSIEEPIIAIQGENSYITQVAARAGANAEIKDLILTNLPVTEFVPLGSIIYQVSTGYTNDVKARIRTTDTGENYVNYRFFGGSRLLTLF